MRHICFLASIAISILTVSCQAANTDPVSTAIENVVRQSAEMPSYIEKTMMLDSTTFATEISRRRGIYELRIRQNSWRKEKYLKDKMPTNARRMDAFNKKDRIIIAGLDSIALAMGADTNHVAYYDYAFKYYNKTEKNKKTIPKIGYAVLTPKLEVLSWSTNKKDIHKTTGLVIPGYEKLLESVKGMEEDYHLK